MARSQVARYPARRLPVSTVVRRLARGTAVTAAVAASAILALSAGPGHSAAASSSRLATAAPLQLTVTAVNPAFAQDGRTITLSGQVRNASGSTMSGLLVSLWSSRTALPSRQALGRYADGSDGYLLLNQLSPHAGSQNLGTGRTWNWQIRLPVRDLALSCFGVYPLTAQVTTSAGQIARVPIPLPYWPSKPHSCASLSRPRPVAISWIWPLIDRPYQGPCPGLLSDGLAPGIEPGGRLGILVAVGGKYSAKAGLTWAIDPALLDNIRKMEAPFRVTASSAGCAPSTLLPADADARAWLAGLTEATRGQPVFVTPYADVDIAALTRQRGNSDVTRAFSDGELVAHQVLGRGSVPVPLSSARGSALAAAAWPPGGVASSSVLDKLAYLNFGTVILTMPAVRGTYTPGAVTSVLTGIARYVRILLADHGINSLLASGPASSRQAAEILQVKQLYLAETAEIIAEQPGHPEPILVAPPRRWDPSRRLADGLLAETIHAPWLRPTTAGHLESLPAEHAFGSLARSQPRRELSPRLLRRVAALDGQVGLLQSIMVNHDPALYRAIFGIESSAWRGASGGKQAQALLARTTRYFRGQLRKLSIVGNHQVTLGGKASKVTVLIHNPLGYPVRVKLKVHTDRITVTMAQPHTITIGNDSNSNPVKLIVHSNGTAPGTIKLSLTSPNGTPLPTNAFYMHVRPTNFGTVALVILAAALAVFVIASATRALRHGRPGQSDGDDQPGAEPQEPASPLAEAAPPDHGSGGLFEAPGSADPNNRREHLDSVIPDRSELTSARGAYADQDPTFPAGGPTEESR